MEELLIGALSGEGGRVMLKRCAVWNVVKHTRNKCWPSTRHALLMLWPRRPSLDCRVARSVIRGIWRNAGILQTPSVNVMLD